MKTKSGSKEKQARLFDIQNTIENICRQKPTGDSLRGEAPMKSLCMPFPMAGMPMKMLMLSGNIFGSYVNEEGARGRNAVFSTNMIMLDLGSTLNDRHYLNLEFMGTAERWTVPSHGYPLLLQIGEEDSMGQPYLDAQHPHSSPIMGLTLSDTIRLGSGRDALKIYFAPRGETTDGPVAFMHRPTGMINPDAPLGHHIGQDVGHISSTVIGASLKLGNSRFEASTFHGAEPVPSEVDLPIGTPDSAALRLIREFSPEFMIMGSFAYVSNPEPSDPDIRYELRYSASAYNRIQIGDQWKFSNTFIFGAVTNYDRASLLNSFAEEFWFSARAANIWGRIEVLQRTPAELNVSASPNQNSGRWVSAATLGYTHYLARFEGATLGAGASITKDFLPNEFSAAYGGNPWSGKVFLQLKGMRMWEL
jgi:hypothetical protein